MEKVIDEKEMVGYEEERPWGSFKILDSGGGLFTSLYKVKKITVNPGQRLSLQSHSKREETWVCVAGEITVEGSGIRGGKQILSIGDRARILPGETHRASNNGSEPAVFIEVQTGGCLSEDDITRYADDYGRVDS